MSLPPTRVGFCAHKLHSLLLMGNNLFLLRRPTFCKHCRYLVTLHHWTGELNGDSVRNGSIQVDVMPRVPQCILMRLPPHMLHSNVLNRPRWLSSTRYGSEVTTQLIPRYQMDKNDPQTQPTVNLHSCSEDDFPPLFQIESVALYGMAG